VLSGQQPLGAAPIVGIAEGGDWFFVLDRTPANSVRGQFRIHRYKPSGEELREIVVSYRATKVDGAVRSFLRVQATAYADQIPSTFGVNADDILDATWIPDRLPPVQDILADSNGVWVQREMTHPEVWERYDLEGTLIVRVTLPLGFNALAATQTKIVGWEMSNADEIPSLQQYSINTLNVDQH
jgi:hypothetical protein